MKRKLLLAGGLSLALAGAASVWLFLAATSPDAVRHELARLTGARVGLASVERLWMPPGVIVHGLRLETPAYRLELDRLEVRLRLLPLLAGRVTLGSLTLGDARLALAEGPLVLPPWPPESSWEIRHLDLRGTVAGREQELFYLDRATLTAPAGGRRRLELVGSASREEPASLRLAGELESSSAALPAGRWQLQLDALPAQPLLGFLFGDERLLSSAKLHGRATLSSERGTATLEAALRATALDADELVAADLRLRATPQQLTLDSLRGHFVGNRLAANGEVRRWQEAGRELELGIRLSDARLADNTLHYLHELLGRPALGFAETLRGPLAADIKLSASSQRVQWAGRVDLLGLTATPAGLPTLRDLRGRLALAGARVRLQSVTGRVLDTPAQISGEALAGKLALHLDADDVPLSHLPVAFGAELPVTNLQGSLRLDADLAGSVLEPVVSGTAAVVGAGFDFHGLPVRDLAGRAVFDSNLVRVDSLQGRAGDCGFQASGRFAPSDWRRSLEARAVAPGCDLGELLRLAERAQLGFALPLDPATLAGAGRFAADYQSQAWRAELEVAGARWSPPGLNLPLEDIRARLRLDPSALQVRHFSGRLGESSLVLRGQVGRPSAGGSAPDWELELETVLEAEDAARLLPAAWRAWVQVPARLEGRAQFVGSPQDGLHVAAQLQTPVLPPAGGNEGSLAPPAATLPHRFELQGVWRKPVFELERFAAQLGPAELSARGQVQWGAEKNLALHFEVPAGTPLPELLAFVRLPEAFRSIEGAVAARLSVAGPPPALAWNGAVDLDAVSVPGLLTKPVRLDGRVGVSREGFDLQTIQVTQPLGRFTLSGLVRTEGLSRLQARGTWLNLDRLLGQLPKSRLSLPGGNFLARHPLEVTVNVDEVRFLELTFAQVESTFEQQDGAFRVRVPRFALGPGGGRLDVALEPAARRATAHVSLNDIRSETLLSELLKLEPAVEAGLSLDADLAGPLGSRQEFFRGADGAVRFRLGPGRLQKGTLPERLFALAVLLRENFYGFGFLRLARLANPPDLRSFEEWEGTVALNQGRASLDSRLTGAVYDLALTGDVELSSGALELHGDGDFHPGWQFDFSIKSLVDGLSRLLRLARGQHGQRFQFDVAGELAGQKRVQNFRFKD